jgi:hypothetical protein
MTARAVRPPIRSPCHTGQFPGPRQDPGPQLTARRSKQHQPDLVSYAHHDPPHGAKRHRPDGTKPKLRTIRQVISGLTWVFTGLAGWRSGYVKVACNPDVSQPAAAWKCKACDQKWENRPIATLSACPWHSSDERQRKLADAVGERARAALHKAGVASGTEVARSPGQVPGDAATTQARMVSHGWCTTARPSAANGPWPAAPGPRPPPAARRTAEPVADACLLLTMSVPRCLASVWDVVIPVGGSSGKARAQVSG